MLALRLKPDLEKRLATLAEKTVRTKTFYDVKAIEQQLDDMNGLPKVKKRTRLMRFSAECLR